MAAGVAVSVLLGVALAVALWSLRRDLREWWRILTGGDPW